jgi:DNA-binding transcriptional regulator YiaG
MKVHFDIKEIIRKSGGIAKFARAQGIPYRTVQDWKSGRRNPAPWIVGLIVKAGGGK